MLVIICALLFSCTRVTFRPRPGFTIWLHKQFLRSFNGVSLIRLDLSQRHDSRMMYCFHPHAMVANGFGLGMLSIASTCDARVTIAVARSLLWMNPVFKWLVNSHGIGICTVSRNDLEREMTLGSTIGICPGGFEEALLMQTRKDVIFLSKRLGFIHLAADRGYNIVPVLTFGESQIYENVFHLPESVKRTAARVGLPLVWPRGESYLTFNPIKPPLGLRIVFGETISTSQYSSDRDMYTIIHRKYISSLALLYTRFNPYTSYKLSVL
jgi:2-acylglycerol O-acyltransferase 2